MSSSADRGAGERKRSYRPMRKTDNKERGLVLDWIYRFVPIPKLSAYKTNRGILRHPASVLAPESALGSLPSVALSSAQAGCILTANQNVCCFRHN